MKGTRLVKETGIHMKKSCATLSGCATLGASVPSSSACRSRGHVAHMLSLPHAECSRLVHGARARARVRRRRRRVLAAQMLLAPLLAPLP